MLFVYLRLEEQKVSSQILMKNESKKNPGMHLLMEKYRKIFRIPENLNYY
jgi:hypothetical protein